jgi:hypothetical protein
VIARYAHSPSETNTLGAIKLTVGRRDRAPQFANQPGPALLHHQIQTGEIGISLPDPVAMPIAIHSSNCASHIVHHVNVEVTSKLTSGQSVVDRLGVDGDERNRQTWRPVFRFPKVQVCCTMLPALEGGAIWGAGGAGCLWRPAESQTSSWSPSPPALRPASPARTSTWPQRRRLLQIRLARAGGHHLAERPSGRARANWATLPVTFTGCRSLVEEALSAEPPVASDCRPGEPGSRRRAAFPIWLRRAA